MDLKSYTRGFVALSLFISFSSQVYSIGGRTPLAGAFSKKHTIFQAAPDTLDKPANVFPGDHNPAHHEEKVEEEGMHIASDHTPAHKIILEETEIRDLDNIRNSPDDLSEQGFHTHGHSH